MPLVDRPALVLSTLMIVLGIQIISVGLIGEIVAFTYAKDIKDYRVDRVVDATDEVSTDLARDTGAGGLTTASEPGRPRCSDPRTDPRRLGPAAGARARASRSGALSEEELRASRAAMLADHPPGEDLAVFAYGSLIWNPAFHFAAPRARAHPRLSSPLLPVDQPRPRDARPTRA